MNVSGTQPLLSPSLLQKNTIVETGLKATDNVGSTIRRAIVDDQHMKVLLKIIDSL
jgi:hypothetical protein